MIISFKKMAIYSIVVILASATVIWGLRTLTYSEVFNPVEVETTYGLVKLTMRLDRTTYRLGEPVNITLTVTNIGNETVLLGFVVLCKTSFVVCNNLSQIVFDYPKSRVWPAGGGEMLLDSGESLSQTLIWDQLEMDDFPPFASRPVQPGTYYIMGRIGPGLSYVGPPEEGNRAEWIDSIRIETPKIEVEIM